jgi:hypothetical protein
MGHVRVVFYKLLLQRLAVRFNSTAVSMCYIKNKQNTTDSQKQTDPAISFEGKEEKTLGIRTSITVGEAYMFQNQANIQVQSHVRGLFKGAVSTSDDIESNLYDN